MSELTKTDFVQYLNCPKSLWLLMNKPFDYPAGEFSTFAQKIAAEGYEVERHVRQLVSTYEDADRYSFQRVFESKQGLYAKTDMVRFNEDGSIDIYEIKSSTSVKDSQILDAVFQVITATQAGEKVRRIYIVHLNKDYVRNGDIEPAKLLAFSNETVRVKSLLKETKKEISAALNLLATDAIDESFCSCLQLGKANHCESFDFFNTDIPEPSIYNLPRISAGSKFQELVADKRFDLGDIDPAEVSKLQGLVVESHQAGKPFVDLAVIEDFLGSLKYPLYFLDYEAYSSAIPIVDGAKPQNPITFQFSLHILKRNGSLSHHEYLADEAKMPLELVEAMEKTIGSKGSIISWHKTYENSRNKDMAKLYPSKSKFLNNLTKRTVDLEDVFKTGYVDIKFGGSTSIKNVLPVIAPDLSYSEMEIGNGTAAMEGWKRMLDSPHGNQRLGVRRALLEYCELDTLAMVRIFQFVAALV